LENIRLESEIVEIGGVDVLKLRGEIDVYTAPDLKVAVTGMVTEGVNHLVIDMTQVSYMDSSAFGVLLSALKTVKPLGGSVNLAGCSPSVEKILGLTKLDTIFILHKTLEDAVASAKSG